MKERIQEALRRRHRKGDEGFTLIELLVVILIIAILAAVGIVALLSALNAGKKSSAKTALTNAINAAKSVQTSTGSQDFEGLQTATGGGSSLADEEKDLIWVSGLLGAAETTNHVGMTTADPAVAGQTEVIFNSRDASGHCFFVRLSTIDSTRYASQKVAANAACTQPATPTSWATTQKAGWAVSN